jgi:hypothetical protein
LRHEAAVLKGVAEIEHERTWQRAGARQNAERRRRKINEAAADLRAHLTNARLERMNATAMARRLKKIGHGGSERTLRGYVTEACRLGLLPARILAESD